MVTFADCLFAAIVMIVPADGSAEFSSPSFAGICQTRSHDAPSLTLDSEHRLILVHQSRRYVIPLPRTEGAFSIRYFLGSEYATYQMERRDDPALVDGMDLVDTQMGRIMVRFGPLLMD